MKIKSLIGVCSFLGIPFLFKLLPQGMLLHEAAFWLLFLLMLLWVYKVEKQNIVSIGWKQLTAKSILSGIGIGLLLFIVFGIIMAGIQAAGLPLNQEVAQMIAGQSYPVLLLIVIRAAIVEEVLYRGYAFERLYQLTKSKWLAALLPVVVFMLAHLSWGMGHLVFVLVAGGLFMLLYVSKRNLGLLMVAHFTTDVLALLVLPMLVEA